MHYHYVLTRPIKQLLKKDSVVEEVLAFLFETIPGMGILIGSVFVISFLVCIIMERKTKKTFVERATTEDDWEYFEEGENPDTDND